MGEGRDTAGLGPSEPSLNARQRTEEGMKGSCKDSLWPGPLGEAQMA